ncbi:hypothetical protein C8Q79DRAFT_996656 [Trametes meyenii]|nr:hypothetical protein C8Q79DRAFT_996656 [Trametes meyenii]
MPAFEGLLPLQDDEICADLLFELANWHALAKLRLHTEVTLEIFESATRHMYEGMRTFAATTCKRYVTRELAKKAEIRRSALLRTLRARDDYVPHHVRCKQDKDNATTPDRPNGHAYDNRKEAALPPTSPYDHHAMSQTQQIVLKLRTWLAQHHKDPATKNFLPLLRDHLLGRMFRDYFGTDFAEDNLTHAQLNGLEIQAERIYWHKLLCINYMTYDMRWDQDTINPHTHPDIMLLARDSDHAQDAHPFWYGRVIDIFHAQVRYTGPEATPRMRTWQRMEFLWVRWLKLDPDYPSGFQEWRLPRVCFVDASGSDRFTFGFVDPADVLGAAYLMPAFAYGTTSERLSSSRLARRPLDNNEDYEYYYVGM